MVEPASEPKKATPKYFDIYAPVFYPAAAIALVFIVVTLGVGEPMEKIFNDIQNTVTDRSGWLLVIAINVFLFVALFFALSPFGRIRLGGADALPEFNRFSWLSMLFSAGMGIGLLFFSVAEPMLHFGQPPYGEPKSAEAALTAMQISFFHYGFHVWGIYCIVGLALAFFAFNRGLPLTIRSAFYPLLGERIYGPWGSLIDTVAVVATLFGLATTLGFGAQQIGAGFHFLFGAPNNVWTQVLAIGLITLMATTSVVLGLERGIKTLSVLNIRLGAVLLGLMLFIGPTTFLLDGFVQHVGGYLQQFFNLSTLRGVAREQGDFFRGWSSFYWSWWISWAPFVGMFIARISRGRTVREFVFGVLLLPTILTFFWFSVFGGSALFLELGEPGVVSEAVDQDISTALFVMLEQFPLSTLTSIVGIIMVISFFVTSSDSGSLVIDHITSGGKLHAPVGQRIFWAATEGAIAATLLLGGGLSALQAGSVSTGLPFALLLLVMCYSLYWGLRGEVGSD